MTRKILSAIVTAAVCLSVATGFSSPFVATTQHVARPSASGALFAFGGKKNKNDDTDLSSIETRDLTREEMLEINKQNEEIMNMELQMMTIFSLVLSLPILYLCWVAFYSD